jgi:hypothetical protein
VGNLSVVAVARAVEWRWIGGRLVIARSRVLAVEWLWCRVGVGRVAVAVKWRSSGGGGGGEGDGEGNLSVVARAVE